MIIQETNMSIFGAPAMFQGIQRDWGRCNRGRHPWVGVLGHRGGEPWDGHQLRCLGPKLLSAGFSKWWWDCQALGAWGELTLQTDIPSAMCHHYEHHRDSDDACDGKISTRVIMFACIPGWGLQRTLYSKIVCSLQKYLQIHGEDVGTI